MTADSTSEFYEHQRAIGTIWGVVLPSWESLSWDEKIEWQEREAEQLRRDSEPGA